jgi:tetratricopeptide (TPR) repeat protein
MGLFTNNKSTDDYAKEGNKLFDEGEYLQAVSIWLEGLNSLNKPLNMQSEAVWFQTSIADAYFMLGEYEKAYPYLWDAKSNITGEGYTNPFVMLRLGQCSFELGKDDAAEYLIRAYMLAGDDIFESEDEKYFDQIKNLV